MQETTLTLTDPTPTTQPHLTFLDRAFSPLVKEERDLAFVRLSIWLTLVFLPLLVIMFLPGNFRWWMAPLYWALYAWYLGPFILMLHNTSHRVLYKKKYDLLNKYIPWVLGPMVGQSPGTYYAHHMGIHHADGNLPKDLSSTMPYQRDSFIDFMKYYLRFMVSYPQMISYFRRNKRFKMLRMLVVGEVFHIALILGLLYWNWRPALVAFVIPFFMTRFLLMAGNWTQHAFVDPDDPTNDYKTVITFINSPYNHRCFNDGYHLGHHLKANRHWLDMPDDFLQKKQTMIEAQSIVFTKLDYFMIFLLLMFKRHRFLTKFYVQLTPEDPLSDDEIVALFHKRLAKFSPEQLQQFM